jgi:hypothetical protein
MLLTMVDCYNFYDTHSNALSFILIKQDAGHDSSVGIVTRNGPDGPGFESR